MDCPACFQAVIDAGARGELRRAIHDPARPWNWLSEKGPQLGDSSTASRELCHWARITGARETGSCLHDWEYKTACGVRLVFSIDSSD